MRTASAVLNGRDFKPGQELARSELEGGADVDGLAIAPLVLKSGHAIMFDIVPDAASQREPLRQRIGSADVERNIVTLAQRGQRAVGCTIRTHRDSASEALQRIADA